MRIKFVVTNGDPIICLVKIAGEISKDWKTVDGDLETSTMVGEHPFLIEL